ncbi:MAG TPA: EamA family transporter [Solirubrobacteraceae bacterium]
MPRALVLLAAVLFGTTGTAQALGPGGSPLSVGAARVAVGAALLALAAWAVERHRRSAASQTRGATPAWPLGALAGAAVGIAGYQLSFFAAVDDTGVAVGTVVALGSAPALAGLLGRVVDGSPLTRRWAACTALATAGVVLLVLAGSDAKVSALGVGLALVAGASYAAYTVGSKRMLAAGHAPEAVMARGFGLAALLLAPVLVVHGGGPLASSDGFLLALYLGAIPTALAYILFAHGLRLLTAGETATLTLAEPLTASVLGAVVLAERPGSLAIAGAALVLAGLAALALPRGARPGFARRAPTAEPRALAAEGGRT